MLSGHLWTIAPAVAHRLRGAARAVSVAAPWSTRVFDPTLGPVRVTGFLAAPPNARAALVVVHGLGGNAASHYVGPAARAAAASGLACLRLELRGADGSGEDLYHAGLTEDLHAALASPELSRFEDLFLLGYSLGGHLALRAATERLDPRVRAVAAVCPPLDLEPSCRALDEPRRWLYRRYVLRALSAMYAPIAARRALPVSAEEAATIRSLRVWDERIVAPRFGFRDAAAYYAAASVAPRLGALEVPALLVVARHDPMVPEETLAQAIAGASPRLVVRYSERGGHVGFPADLDLELGEGRGLEPQVLDWLVRERGGARGAERAPAAPSRRVIVAAPRG